VSTANEELADVEVELEADAPAAEDVVIEKAEDKPEPAKDPVDDALADLKRQLEAERNSRAEAERRAAQAAQESHQARNEAQDTNLHLVVNAIETVKQNNAILKANLRDAMAAQDFDTAADIQAEMSSNAAKLLQLEQGKQSLESQPRQEAPKPYANDPVEALASQLTPRSAAWVRAHPEYATDTAKYQKMLAAHNMAVADGIAPDSDAYFESVEDLLRIRKAPVQQDDDAMAGAAQVTQRRSAPPAAPVSRETGNGPGTQPNRVRLSAEEREFAEMNGMTAQEYAKHKLALQKEGKLH